MAEKTPIKILEREYVIPLRAKRMHVPRYKKTPKSIRTIKEFIVKHMKIYDRDLDKVKLSRYLNEYIWSRGIKHPVHKVKVKAIKEKIGEDEIVRVELVNYTPNLKFKKAREERKAKESEEKVSKKKAEKPAEEKDEQKVEEEKEKLASVVEAGKKMEKKEHKQEKHETKIDKAPKHHQRNALQK